MKSTTGLNPADRFHYLANGITGKDLKDANGQRLVWFHSEFNLIILVLSFEDMKKIEEGKNLIVLLKEKYQELVEG